MFISKVLYAGPFHWTLSRPMTTLFHLISRSEQRSTLLLSQRKIEQRFLTVKCEEKKFPSSEKILNKLQKYPFEETDFFPKNYRIFVDLAHHFANQQIINENQISREIYSVLSANDPLYNYCSDRLNIRTKYFSTPFKSLLEEQGSVIHPHTHHISDKMP